MKKLDYHSLFSETSDDADDVVAFVFVAVVTTSERWRPNIPPDGENADKVTWNQELTVNDSSQPLPVRRNRLRTL